MDEGAGEAYPLDDDGVGTVDMTKRVAIWTVGLKRRKAQMDTIETVEVAINGGVTTSKGSRTSSKAGKRGNTLDRRVCTAEVAFGKWKQRLFPPPPHSHAVQVLWRGMSSSLGDLKRRNAAMLRMLCRANPWLSSI